MRFSPRRGEDHWVQYPCAARNCCCTICNEQDLFEAGKWIGELWLVLSARERDRPKDEPMPGCKSRCTALARRPVTVLELMRAMALCG